MTILHVKLNGPTTQINLPSGVSRFNMKLKSYRVMFNKNNHGYYQAMVNCSILNGGNAMSFAKPKDAQSWTYNFPLLLNPELKDNTKDFVDWDFGYVNTSASTISFSIDFMNCIERKRFDLASFDSTEPALQMLYGKSTSGTHTNGALTAGQVPNYSVAGATGGRDTTPYWGNKIPMYTVPYTNQPGDRSVTLFTNDNLTSSAAVTGNNNGMNFSSTTWRNADGTSIATNATAIYPSSSIWVHTGVQISGVDPQPGGLDFDMRATTPDEQRVIDNSGGAITGSGYRRGAIIYPYTIDLVFELSI